MSIRERRAARVFASSRAVGGERLTLLAIIWLAGEGDRVTASYPEIAAITGFSAATTERHCHTLARHRSFRRAQRGDRGQLNRAYTYFLPTDPAASLGAR